MRTAYFTVPPWVFSLTTNGCRRNRQPPGALSAQLLLPGQKRVVDLEQAAADLHSALDAPRRHAGVAVAELPVERLRACVVDADRHRQKCAPARQDLALGRARQRARDTAASVGRQHLHVL